MAGKAILPMLASEVNPKTPRAVEKVQHFQILTMFGYLPRATDNIPGSGRHAVDSHHQ